MARMVKDCARETLEFLPAGSKGYLFVGHEDKIFDSRSCHIVHHGLDTVRQLYNCLPDFLVYSKIQGIYESGYGESIEFDGDEWVISHGGRSGYRYKLKNDDLGIIVFLGSTFSEPNYNAAHLKIQCSPVFLLSRDLQTIQRDMDNIAKLFVDQLVPSGVAVHICADVQGWAAPSDLDCRITTRAHRVMKHSGIQDITYDVNDAAVVYGRGQSFTFGKAGSMQFACYNKTKAVQDKGEVALWSAVWSESDNFDINIPVWRLEARFHHTVVQQFARGTGFNANSLIDLEKHFSGLWQYALNNFRFDDSKTMINPFWQWLRDDLAFYHHQKLDIDYQRQYKAASVDGLPNDRSVAICFGQLCSIYRKKKLSFNKASMCLLNSGIWELICAMYVKRGKTPDDVLVVLADKLEQKTVH